MNTRLLLGLPFIISVCLGAACSSGEGGTKSDDQNLNARPGELHGMCGGIAGITCRPGLRCRMEAHHPDASGRCEDPGLATCLAIPVCDEGDSQVESCPPVNPQCYTRSMCGRTISCKKPGTVPGGTGETVTVEGELVGTVGIGGENTGKSIKTGAGTLELVLDDQERSQFVDGRFARVKGKKTTLSGVETHDRSAIDVTEFVVCPNSSAVINCMPVTTNPACEPATRSWIQDKCEGVSFLD